MQQKWWLWLICLIACNVIWQKALGQTRGLSHNTGRFYHEELDEKGVNHEVHEGHEERFGGNHEAHEGSSRSDLVDYKGKLGSENPKLVESLHAKAPQGLSLIPADSLHRGRFWVATGLTAALYTGSVIVLNEAWYAQFPRSSFHFFDDTGEWRYMDKMGHLYTSYFESLWGYKIARWSGVSDKTAIWTGAALGLFFQSTIEVLDGFSAEWGFSPADMGFNILGSGVFLAQQRVWGEQRICLKVSSTPVTYPDAAILSTDGEGVSSLRIRTDDLFGTSFAERFLKDYNTQTTWLSVNVHAFLNRDSRFPKWLNIAIGYGAENMYGGYGNSWSENGAQFELAQSKYPRYGQLYLSPDIDFTRIPSKSPFVRTLLGMLNVFKMPGPVLEISGEKGAQVKLRW